MVKDYMKKQVVIQAMVWTGDNVDKLEEFMGKEENKNWYRDHEETGDLYIHTLEWDHRASIGDYIIKGVKGEFYPCKPDIFEMTYEEVQECEGAPANDDWKRNRSFSAAIEWLKEGYKVTRKGWNGKGMYLWHVPEATVPKEWIKDKGLLEAIGENESMECLEFIRMKTADGKILSGWLASQTDMLSEDWEIYEGK